MNGHLQKMADANVSVRIICNGIYFPHCKLICAARPEKGFGLIVSGGVFVTGDRVSVSYVFSPYTCTFEADIVGVQTGSMEDVLLHIRTPGKIARLERRKGDRVKPSEEHPVTIALLLRNDQTVRVIAIEMSLNGICFSLPCLTNRLNIGSQVLMTIGLPKLGNMEAAGVVRAVTEGSGSAKYGVEFDPPPEFDSLLAQYLYSRKVEIRAENKSGAKLRKESILVMMKDTGQGKYAFMCSDSPVNPVDDLNSISEIVSVDVIDFLEDEPWADSCEVLL